MSDPITNQTVEDVDLSQLLVPDIKFAVRCETEEEAEQFVAAVNHFFPCKAKRVNPNNPRWDDDNGGDDGGRAYFPNLNDAEGDDPLLIGSVSYAVQYEYTLVSFQSLLQTRWIEESDMPISTLFDSIM